MRTVMLRWTSLSIALCVLSASANTLAQSAPVAESPATLVQEGRSLLQQGLAQEALARFTRAYEAGRSPTALAHMGVAEGALGHPVEAERFLREALEAPQDALMQPAWVERFRENLRVARRSVGLFMVRGDCPGAEVYLNGRRVGVMPFSEPIRVRAETVRMRVQRPGFYSLEREVIIGGELAVTTEQVQLNPVVSDANTSAPRVTNGTPPVVDRPVIRPVIAPVLAPAAGPTVVVVQDRRDSEPARPAGPVGALTGLAVGSGVMALLGGVSGAVGVAIAVNNADTYRNGGCVMMPTLAECETAARNVDLGNLVTAAGFIAGGVFAAGTIGFGIAAAVAGAPASPRPAGASTARVARAAWSCGVGAGSAFCAGSF
jgi:hypothetical protein